MTTVFATVLNAVMVFLSLTVLRRAYDRTVVVDGKPLTQEGWFDNLKRAGSVFWLKDNKLVVLPDVTWAQLKAFGIRFSSTNRFRTSKRLSRFLRPTRFFTYLPADTQIVVDASLDPAIYDGIAFISPRLLTAVAQTSENSETLLAAERFEITLMTPQGQIKGHAVLDHSEGAPDVRIAHGQVKAEVAFAAPDGRLYLALEPVRGKNAVSLDIQSLINFRDFLSYPKLLAYTRGRFAAKMDSISRGEVYLSEDSSFILAQWIARGGRITDFPALHKMATGLVVKQADRFARKMKVYAPGLMRRYLTSDVRGTGLMRGECDWDGTSLYVSDLDYVTIAGWLGGADQDDSVLVLPFFDLLTREELVLIWRNPNQPGEYALLSPVTPTGTMMSGYQSSLITHISAQPKYADVPAEDTNGETWPQTVARAQANRGAIGAFANWMMLYVSVTGKPAPLPCSFESVIDSAVKDGRDVSHALAAVSDMVDQFLVENIVPLALRERFPDDRDAVASPLDDLLHGLTDMVQALTERAEAMRATQVAIPAGVFEADRQTGRKWNARFRTLVAQLGKTHTDSREAYRQAAETMADKLATMTEAEQKRTILGMLSDAYYSANSDAHVFSAAVAERTAFWNIMAELGCFANEDTPRVTPVSVLHVWYNWCVAEPRPKMSEIPADFRTTMKQSVAELQPARITLQDREVYDENGRLLGLLPKASPVAPQGEVVSCSADTREGSLMLLVAAA